MIARGYSISTVGLIEGHGAGKPIDDNIEIMALSRLMEEDSYDRTSYLGSIKSNIGDCGAASGAAGIIKAVMALKRKILPQTLHCKQPNAAFDKTFDYLRPNISGKSWKTSGLPRRASVSSMGFGGSNAHITLEEANIDDLPLKEEQELLASNQSSELFMISAGDIHELKWRIVTLIPILSGYLWPNCLTWQRLWLMLHFTMITGWH